MHSDFYLAAALRAAARSSAPPAPPAATVIKRRAKRDRERIVELSTLDFLYILEAEQRIQSAEQVFELAASAGRFPSRAEKLSGHDEATRAAIQNLIRPLKR